MAAVDAQFARLVDDALSIVAATEALWLTAPPTSEIRQRLRVPQLEAVYEAIFLRVFGHWEKFLEDVTVRWMARHTTPSYTPVAAPGHSLYPSISTATTALFFEHGHQRDFLLWHKPSRVRSRVSARLVNCPVEVLCNAHGDDLGRMADIRHHIAHGSADTKTKFCAAAIHLTGADHGGRPGRMLRSASLADPLNQPKWIRCLTDSLKSYASDVCS